MKPAAALLTSRQMAFLGPSLRRRRVTERPAVRAAAAILLSLLVNAAAVWLLASLGAFETPRPARETRVALAPLTADAWEANRAITGGAPPRAPPPTPPPPRAVPPPPPEEDSRTAGQVVDVAPSKNNTRPKDSKFLSERDNTVEKETRSRFAGKRGYENTLPMPSDGARKAPRPAEQRGEGGQADQAKAGKETPEAGGTGADRLAMPKQPAQEKLALAPNAEGPGPGEAVAPRDDRQRIAGSADALQLPGAPGEPDGGGKRRSGRLDARLLPDAQSLQRIAGGPSADLLEGVEESDGTSLNTRSFKYATFLNRAARAIFEEWNPNRAYGLRDPDGTMFPMRAWGTTVDIVLEPDGALRMVKVLKPSGLDFLDQEVVRAARVAAPFPNPPPGLVENGAIRFAIRFVLDVQGSPSVIVPRPGRGPVPYPGYRPGASQRPYPE
jgi:TonB family protein